MGRLFAVEVVYRGIFQKTLAKNITRAISLAAHHEGKPGISFGRYGDSPSAMAFLPKPSPSWQPTTSRSRRGCKVRAEGSRHLHCRRRHPL